MAASSDWEEEFAGKMLEQRRRYGARWEPTGAQIAKLRQICGKTYLDDGYDR